MAAVTPINPFCKTGVNPCPGTMSPQAICGEVGGQYSDGACTVVAQAILCSQVPEQRTACLAQLTLPGGRSGTDCYTATRNPDDGTVTTKIVLDDACIADAATWFPCITASPVSETAAVDGKCVGLEKKQEASGGGGDQYIFAQPLSGNSTKPGSLLSEYQRLSGYQ